MDLQETEIEPKDKKVKKPVVQSLEMSDFESEEQPKQRKQQPQVISSNDQKNVKRPGQF
jgi:hypothetical protein